MNFNQVKMLSISILAMSLLSACSSNEPKEITQERVNQLLELNEENLNVSLRKDYYTIYNDRNLELLIKNVLENNIDLKNAILSLRKVMYQENLLLDNLFPSINISSGFNLTKNLEAGVTSKTFSQSNLLNYELDIWSKLSDEKEAGKFLTLATASELEILKETLVNNTINAYFQLIYLNKNIQLIENYVKNMERMVKVEENKLKNGLTTELYLLQVKESLVNAQNNLLDAKKTKESVLNILNNLLKTNAFDESYVTNLDLNKIFYKDIGKLNLNLIEHRQDVKQGQFIIQQYFKKYKATQKAFLPSIKIGGVGVNFVSDNLDKLFEVGNLNANISIDLPFLNFYKMRNQIDISKVEFEQQVNNYEKTINNAYNEIYLFYQNYRLINEQRKNLIKKLTYQQKIVNLYKNQYNGGLIDISDYLAAMNNEINSKIELNKVNYLQLVEQNGLFKAIGGVY